MIQTITGPIKKEDIGFCHSHEHLFLADGVPATINPALRIDNYELTVKELQIFKEIGGTTIVDAQPLGCGRIEESLYKASLETRINIIAATGFHKLAFYREDHWIFTYHANQLTDVFINELKHGMYIHTDKQKPKEYLPMKAGFIKVAIDQERLMDKDKKWFIAAAEASLATGYPIMCHTESKEQAMYITKFLLNVGLDPAKIIICHLDRTLDQLDVHLELAKIGVFLEYDTIGRFKYHSDEEEARFIAYMIHAGLEDHILLGLDTTRERLKSYGGKIGLDHLKKNFLPLLKSFNIKDSIIEKLVTINPGNAFSNNTLKGDGE